AALFALHPMHVESVAWATERKDVLSVFFGLLTLWAYARYLEAPSRRRYVAVFASYLLWLLAKPMLLTLPFVFLLLDCWPLRRLSSDRGSTSFPRPTTLPRLVWEKIPLFLLAAGIGVLTVVAREDSGAPIPLSVIPLSARLANAVTAYGWYLTTTF